VGEVAPSDLLHLAWCTEHGAYWTSPTNLDWVATSLSLVREVVDAGAARVVVAGTCAEYEWGEAGPLSERRSRLLPASLYGVAKLALLNVLTAYARVADFSLAWGRIFSVYGPGEDARRLVPSVALRLIGGKPGPPLSGELRRDYLYVDDASRAFVELLDARVEGPVNIASGVTIELRELAAAIAEACGRPDLVSPYDVEPRPGEPLEVSADVQRLQQEVGFRSEVGLPGGLERTIASLWP
jgi:nucleoside-diphosphate-sugar epimerase